MIINSKNKWFSNEPRQKKLISKNTVDMPGTSPAYLLFSGNFRKKYLKFGEFYE